MTGHVRLFLQSGNPKSLFAAFLYFDASFMVWVILGALGNFIATDMGLSGTEKGLMTALPILSGAVLRLPMGIAADRLGSRPTGIIGLSLTLAPLLIGWVFADSLPLIYLVGILLGVAGASFAVALPLASRWYPPEHQGLALGIAGAGNSGTVFAALLAPRLAEAFGWQAVFGLAAIPIVITLALFVALAKDSPAPIVHIKPADYLSILRDSDALRFCVFYSVTFGGFVGLASYLAIFFRDQYGLSKVSAGDLTAVCVFAGSFARPVGGVLADRLGGIPVLLGLLTAIGIAALALASMPVIALAVALFFATMALLGMGNGAVFQLVPQRFSQQMGVLTGLVGFAGGIGGFLLPFLLGLLKDATGTYATGFALFAAVSVAAAAILLLAVGGWQQTWAPRGSMARDGRSALAEIQADS